ncbi:hypothetical protein [Ramlibacter sp.]|uniref:hypothetical protein n=1 Tax=Ramlibacter sp. TaxID=1917967 RepID=UPI002D0BB831|nr:hypothetical protein [Ramlibacter sp.]HWI82998.1 hypothetical protein [Ramlibacter sp.]
MALRTRQVLMDFSAAPSNATGDAMRRRIVRAALRLAEAAGSWDAVHVHAVAAEAGVTMAQLREQFAHKDAIGEGLFDIADAELLACSDEVGWSHLPYRERLERAILRWLDALTPHRRLVGELLRYKLHPEHVHLQVLGVARISRTVQWIREVAMLPSVGWRRELEEAALTSIYLATFACWLTDGSLGAHRTRTLLHRLLASGEGAARRFGFAPPR